LINNKKYSDNVKLFFTYLGIIIFYNAIFESVYLGDTNTMFELAKKNEINEWQMLGGFLIGRFSLMFRQPTHGLLIINVFFWVCSATLLHLILSTHIKSKSTVFFLVIFSPLVIFSNIIYKESIAIYFFILVFTRYGWISPICSSVLRVNLFIESILVWASFNYKQNKWRMLIPILVSLTVFVVQLNLYNTKNGVINTVLDSYIIGVKIQTEQITGKELKRYYGECREFEQLYVSGTLPQPTKGDTNRLKAEIKNLILNESVGVIKHLMKKLECTFFNHNRYFLLPSATYRIGSKIRDNLTIALTQLNPLFRPLVGLIFLLIPGTMTLVTRLILIAGLLFTSLMHTNPEARYFFPFIIAGIINMAKKINQISVYITGLKGNPPEIDRCQK
jgi:hypothetical protein